MMQLPDTPDVVAARQELTEQGMLWLSAPAGWAAAERVLAPLPREVVRRRLGPAPAAALREVRDRLQARHGRVVFVLQGLAGLYGARLVEALTGLADFRTLIEANREHVWVVLRSELPQAAILGRIPGDDYLPALGRLPPEMQLVRASARLGSRRLETALDGHPRLVTLALDELQRGVSADALAERAVELARPVAEVAAASIRRHAPTALDALRDGVSLESLDPLERDALARWDLLRARAFDAPDGPGYRWGPPALVEAVRRLA